jgi:FtsP/CotA-like multicopper oxidase with cupredoxin domain
MPRSGRANERSLPPMISRKDVLKLGAAGALGAAVARTAALAAQASSTGGRPSAASDPMRRLTTAELRALPHLKPSDSIARTGNTKRYLLELGTATVQPLPGHSVPVRAVNGESPGPVLRATEGDDVEITVVNRLTQPTSIHWHGIPLDWPMDGAAMISQSPIAPGERFTYRWIAPQAGTYMYHSHYHDLEQSSIVGLIVVDPQHAGSTPVYDHDIPIMITSLSWEMARNVEAQAILSDSMLMSGMAANPKADPLPDMGDSMDRMDMVEYWCFNGKTYPATVPIVVKQGQLVRVRFGNITGMTHPVHMHGHWFRWIAQDASPLPNAQIVNTVAVNPGQTIDIDFVANNPGVWPLHCHILAHMVDNHDIMTGLMTMVQYEGFPIPPAMKSAMG